MKKILLLFALTMSSLLVFSQKIDLDRYSFKASFLQLPSTPFPLEYTTFSTRFIANGINLVDAGYANSERDLEAIYFKINGFKRVSNGGHFTIKIQIDGSDIGKPTIDKKESKTKDKEGKETITISYKLTFKYFVPIMFTITDLNGKIMRDGTVTDGSSLKTYESTNFSTAAAAEKYLTENTNSIKKELLGSYIAEKLTAFQSRIDNEIGFIPHTITDILWTTDSPKHPENDAFRKKCEEAKVIIEEMTPMIPLDKVKINPFLLYFESIITKYPNDEKPERKLRYAAWFNMATIYYWLEDYDNSVRCSEGLIANDYDKSDGENLKAISLKMKAKMANSFIKTSHYIRDVSNATAPTLTAVQEEEEQARQNAFKDKALREAAERETQRQSARPNSGMMNLNQSVNLIGGLIGGEKFRERQRMREDIKELSASIDNLSGLLGVNKNIIELNKAIADDSSSKRNYVARANYFKRNLQYKEAISDYTKALKIDPIDTDILTYRALTYFNGLEQYDYAMDDFSAAIKLKPNVASIYSNRAYAYLFLERYKESIADYQKVLELDRENPSSYLLLGNALEKAGEQETAANTYSELIKLKPNVADYYNLRGWALSNAGKYKEAITDFDKALSIDSENGVYYKNRGNAKNKLGQYASALGDLQIAVDKNIFVHYKSLSNKGDSYFGLGKYKEALENYKEALKIKPDFQEAIDGKKNAEAKLKN